MVIDYLSTGIENARTGKDLAAMLNCNLRDITADITRERRQGWPIIASNAPERPGYYIAVSRSEVKQYCNSLRRRASEIEKTSAALLKAAQKLPDTREAQ